MDFFDVTKEACVIPDFFGYADCKIKLFLLVAMFITQEY